MAHAQKVRFLFFFIYCISQSMKTTQTECVFVFGANPHASSAFPFTVAFRTTITTRGGYPADIRTNPGADGVELRMNLTDNATLITIIIP
jgi:hypothetical protein